MAAPINLPVNAQLQNQTQLQRQLQQATQALRINIASGNSARSLGALSQPLGRLTGQADEFSKSLDAANARVLAFGASVGVVNALSNAFKSLVSSTIEVEKAITAISVVGDQFAGKNKQLSQGLFAVAKATGQSFQEVSKAALEFSRQGLSLEQTLQRTQDALVLTRLTGLDAAKSVEGLTASVNAFAKAGLSTTQILNKLAAVDQAFAVSSADLIDGFSRSAAVAQNAGVTFDELAGIITALQQETSRGGAVIGNALKTIFTRLQDTSTLNQLRGLGVAVQDLEGNLLPARQILQNLAKDVEGLGQITRAGIFKDVAGTFQINQLISLVGDLNKENSVAAAATKKAAGATNEAFVANEKLNQSLDAIINKVALTGKQLGALLGEIGLGDNLKGILDGINSFLEGATNLLQGDDLGSRFAKGIIKGIGSVLTGPGIGLFLAIIAKLSFDLAKFGVQSLKTFFGIGQAAKQQQQVQESIVQTLIRNQSVLSQILNTQGGQNAQALAFLNILRQEEQVLQNIRTIAGGIAAPLIAQGYRAGAQGIQRRSAGGYLPAQEASDVRRGVGGASPSSKVVAIPNFAFGGGKRGTMIANTSEYIVPNYAGGGSAIFNQDMVKTMGLPPGAKKITASGGFVPNFASSSLDERRGVITYNKFSVSDLPSLELAGQADPFDNFSGKIQILQQKKNNNEYNELAKDKARKIITKLGSKGKEIDKTYLNRLIGYFKSEGVDSSSISGLRSAINNATPRNAGFITVQNRIKGILGEIDASKLSGKSLAQGNAYLDLVGGGEVKTRKVTPLKNLIKKVANTYLSKNYIRDNKKEDFVNAPTLPLYIPATDNLKQSINLKASGGYIPNFANYVYDSDRLGGDKQKILQAILDSTKKKDLLVGPAGAGKSTLGSGLGTFISSIDDISKASSFTILSGAALTKEKGLSQDLRAKLAAVQASGGKVSYLGVTNQELLSRREKRATGGSVEGDLRSAAQLAGSKFAPLNQGAFIKQLKRSSSNFELLRESKKNAATNQQLAILGLYGENGNIDGSPVYTLKSQRPNLFKDIEGNLKKNVTNLVKAYASRIGKKIGVPVGAKDIKKSLTQIPSLSGYMFEDVLNQLAGPNFDTATESSGSRIDFPLTKNLREVFGVTGTQIYAEAKLNPYSGDALKSIAGKQLALAGGAQGPVERSADKLSSFRERAIAAGLGKQGKLTKEQSALRKSLLEDLKKEGLIGASAGSSSTESTAALRALGMRSAASGYIPNFVDLNKSESYISAQRKRSFQASTYRKASGVIGSLFKILPEKFFTDGVLGDAVNGAETNGILKAIKDSSYYMASFAGPKAVNFVAQTEKNGLKVSEGLKKKLAQLTVKAATKINRSSEGYVPNFAASALLDAISREKSAGLNASQIYVDQSPALKSSSNPMGLMVANRRDEPAGGFQGISRARREGVNPKTYGAARGFVPNYAPLAPLRDVTATDLGSKRLISQADLVNFNTALKAIAQELKKGKITLQEAQVQIDNLSKNASSSGLAQKKLNSAAKNLITVYDGEIKSRKQQAKDLRKGRAEAKANKNNDAPTGQFADLAGKLVVAQTAMSFFTGAVEGSGGQLEKLGTSITQVAGSLTQVFFLLQSLKGGQALIGKFTDKLKGLGNSIKGKLPNLLGAGGTASRAGGLVSGIGSKLLPGIGVALTAGYIVKTLADGVKGFFAKDLTATFDGLAEAASVAGSQLTDFGKILASGEIKAASSNFFSSLKGGILEILTLGTADVTSFVDGAGEKRTFESLGTVNEEQLGKVVNDLITANIAAGKGDARSRTFDFLEKELPGAAGLFGQRKIDFEDPKVIEALKTKYKELGIEAEAYRKKQDFAAAQKLAVKETTALINRLQLNKNTVELLNKQYASLQNTILNLDLESAFSKFQNKTLLEVDSTLDSIRKNIKEFDNSINEMKLDFNVEGAKALRTELSKIQTEALTNLNNVGVEVGPGTAQALQGLQELFSKPGSTTEDLQKFLQANAVNLPEKLLNPEALLKQFEEYKKQTLELQNQFKLKEAQSRLDFANKLLIEQETAAIQKRNQALEIGLTATRNTFESEKNIRELRRKISDTKFETSLIGRSESGKLSAQRGRVELETQRAKEDVFYSAIERLASQLEQVKIPESLSPDQIQALTKQRNDQIAGLLKTKPTKGGVRTAATNTETQIRELYNAIAQAEKESAQAAFARAEKEIETAYKFQDTIVGTAYDFNNIILNGLSGVFNQLIGQIREGEVKKIDKDRSDLVAKQNALEQDYNKRASDFAKISLNAVTSENVYAGRSNYQTLYGEDAARIISQLNETKEKIAALDAQKAALNTPVTAPPALSEQDQEKRDQQRAAEKKAREDSLDTSIKGIKATSEANKAAATTEAILKESRLAAAAAAAEADRKARELSQALSEIGDSALILSQRIRDYFIGLPAELAGLQFSALQSTSPEDLASNLIQQDVLLNNKGQEKENVESIAKQTALRQKSFELATAESASRRRELEIELQYLEEFFALKEKTANLSEEDRIKELAALKRRQIEEQRTFGAGLGRGIAQLQTDVDNFQSQLGEQIPQLFSDNLAQGLNDAISGAKSLKDALRDAATSFFQEITRQNISNLAKTFTSGIGGFFTKAEGKASGGLISGGSGAKDDVPAMLMGGEYVIKKSAVKKYGSGFFDALNKGSVKGFANGGGVQSGAGGFYVPGDYGEGSIRGKGNLLAFAGQSFTSGQYDRMGTFGLGGASVSLEAESARLTAFGRENSPLFERVQQSKEEAFKVYLDQLNQEKQYRDQLKQMEKAEKERQKQLITSVVSAVVTTLASVAAEPFKAGFSNAAASSGASGLSKFGAGVMGGFGKGGVSGQGGLGNLFSGNFKAAFNNIAKSDIIPAGRASGGMIYGGSGTRDDVPAMLTGGEFVLNNRATRKLGVQNLNRLNAGETNGGEDRSGAVTESLLSKLDELIQATRESSSENVVVNVSSSETQGPTENGGGTEKELQRKIRQAVLDVIAQEKRLGGSLNKDNR